MNVYLVTGWSFVPGDRAIVEADTEAEAIRRLHQELTPWDLDDRPPVETWTATLLPRRPLVEIIYRD
jgi:hypothetical protein